jgi:short-subunit dehydrogenase
MESLMNSVTAERKIAWVTGASSGIGRAVALKLADSGWLVAASARSADKLDALAAERPGSIHAYPLDVTDGEAAASTVLSVEHAIGPIDLALFSAGSYKRESARTFDASALGDMVNLNVTGTGNSLQAVMKPMMQRRSGQIAVIASVAGYIGLPGGGFYGATKAALINLCEALRPQLEREGVKLQLISPGFVDTPLTKKNDFPMPFLISQEKAADAIVSGLESRRFEIVFPWQMAVAMKLLRALPYALSLPITRRMLREE